MSRAIFAVTAFGLILSITLGAKILVEGGQVILSVTSPPSGDQDEAFGTNSPSAPKISEEEHVIAQNSSKEVAPLNSTDVFVHPYVVSLRRHNEHICGGTILTSQLILTVAHCVQPVAALTHVVVSNNATRTRDSYEILRAIPHELYRSYAGEIHDVAIVILKENIRNPRTVRLQKSPKTVADRSLAQFVGWRKANDSGEFDQLRKVDVPLLYPRDCKAHFCEYSAQWVCVDSRPGDVCNGDSGNPLMFDGNQIGIASMTLGGTPTDDARQSGRLTVFTRVSAYFNWIREIVLRFQGLD